jgi:hypothetical protein
MPFQRRYYREMCEQVARAASVPKDVWNMRGRHGGESSPLDQSRDRCDVPEALVARVVGVPKEVSGCR